MTTNSDNESNFLNKIHQAYDSCQWENVIQLSMKVDEDSDDFLDSRQLAAIAEYQLGSLEKAIQFLDEVIDSNHNNPNLFLNYANFMALSNDSTKAIFFFKKSLKLNPNSAAAFNNLGSVYFDLNKIEESLGCFQSAIKLNPNYWEAYASLANIKFQQKNYRQSIENYQRAYQINSNDLVLLNNYALALMRTGEHQLAAEIFQKALTIKPHDAKLFIPLSAILETQGNQQQAEETLSKGLQQTPWYFSNTQNNENTKTELITFSGLQKCLYDLDENNQVKLNGGHFYSKYLIDEEKFVRCRYHIVDKNIESDKTLPNIDLYINTISDPDLESDSLNSLSKYLHKKENKSIINHPDKILLTSRDKNYQRLNGIQGLLFPKTIKLFIDDANQVVDRIQMEFKFPVLIRESGTQTGTSFEKLENLEQLNRAIVTLQDKEIYVIEYLDTSFRDDNNGIFFRRFRFFFIDGKMYPVTCHIHQHWNVHSIDRSSVMQQQNNLTTLEKDFLNEPQNTIGIENYNTLNRLPKIIQLDFFGVDFSLTQDNQLVVFEVNTAMNHTFNYVDKFPYLKPHLEQISLAFHMMIKKRSNSLK